nr:MAG TPA: hypothetical protein [Caudoviricetes sp.]
MGDYFCLIIIIKMREMLLGAVLLIVVYHFFQPSYR